MSGLARKTEAARNDIRQIADYISEQSGNLFAGEAFLDRFEECLNTLATQPFMGPSRDDLQSGLRYQPFERYSIFYKPADNGIEVIRVLHSARDLESMFH